MDSPSKIYTKRLHISGMIVKNSASRNSFKHKQHQSQKLLQNQEKYMSVNENEEEFYQNQRNSSLNQENITKVKKKRKKSKKYRYNDTIQQNQSINSQQIPVHSSHKKLKLQKIKLPSSLSVKYNKKVTLIEKDPSISQFDPDKKSISVVKVINLYPKKESQILRCKKATAMQKYDYLSENMRLAQKLLSMKPTKPCDKRQQQKFFKKQKHFKELHSYSVNLSQFVDKYRTRASSVTSSLPRINKRYSTVQY